MKDLTPDQQIRAKALECATQMFAGKTTMESEIQDLCEKFEHYIREGKLWK